jgi:predicted acyltransferase
MSTEELEPMSQEATPGDASQRRLLSLDAMRGLAMAGMILVNNPGSWSAVYPPLLHAKWHGWTPTDLVFPFFLFIVGVAMPFSFEKRLKSGGRTKLMLKVLQRTVVLFLIGFLLGVFPEFLWKPSVLLEARWPGVLQRIAISYFFASLTVTYLPNLGRCLVAFVLLVVYSLGMLLYPVPEYGAGVFDVVGNFCWWLDNQLLMGHTWKGAPAKGFDPEGVWSTLPAIVTALFGYSTGQQLLTRKDRMPMLVQLFIVANLSLVLAFSIGLAMPINKQLWTVSFVFLTAGLAIHVLCVFFYFIEVRGNRRGLWPLLVFGSNAIVAYVLSSLLGDVLSILKVGDLTLKSWLFEKVLCSWLSPMNASLVFAVCMVIVCLLITSVLHIKKIFIRV